MRCTEPSTVVSVRCACSTGEDGRGCSRAERAGSSRAVSGAVPRCAMSTGGWSAACAVRRVRSCVSTVTPPASARSSPAWRTCATTSPRCCRAWRSTWSTRRPTRCPSRRSWWAPRRLCTGWRSRRTAARTSARWVSSRTSRSTRSCWRRGFVPTSRRCGSSSGERACWGVGRAAGGRSPRSMVLQTRVPDHPVVQAVVLGDPTIVGLADRAQRAALGFPPFGGLAALSGDAVAVAAACDALRHRRRARTAGRLRARTAGAGSVPERQGGSVPERQGGSVPERQGGSVPERQGGSVPGRQGAVTVLGPIDDGRRALVRAPDVGRARRRARRAGRRRRARPRPPPRRRRPPPRLTRSLPALASKTTRS